MTNPKIASKNRKYYLSEQKADSNDNPWFRYVRTLEEYSELVTITPKMASELLHGSFKKAAKPDVVKAVDLSNASITIGFHGKLIEGQLVIEAILMHDVKAIVLVKFNVPDKMFS
jgi:hypothetical protein